MIPSTPKPLASTCAVASETPGAVLAVVLEDVVEDEVTVGSTV
jgi:hypothetical protein